MRSKPKTEKNTVKNKVKTKTDGKEPKATRNPPKYAKRGTASRIVPRR